MKFTTQIVIATVFASFTTVLALENPFEDEIRLAQAGQYQQPTCWVQGKGRGVGRPISVCADHLEQDGLLCYPKCKAGYYGVGPVCWESCHSGQTDIGAMCYKANWFSGCSGDQTHSGFACAKGSYGRGWGYPLQCKKDEYADAGLCYDGCPQGYADGHGPICWQKCPAGTNQCGALCQQPGESCEQFVVERVADALLLALEAGASPSPWLLLSAADTALGYVYPLCPVQTGMSQAEYQKQLALREKMIAEHNKQIDDRHKAIVAGQKELDKRWEEIKVQEAQVSMNNAEYEENKQLYVLYIEAYPTHEDVQEWQGAVYQLEQAQVELINYSTELNKSKQEITASRAEYSKALTELCAAAPEAAFCKV